MRSVRVLLVSPDSHLRTVRRSSRMFALEPLALEYVAAGIGDDHAVAIVDLCVERHPDRALAQAMKKQRPHVVGFGGYSCHARRVRQLVRRTKKCCPEVLVIVGGHHATVLPEDFNLPEVDAIVRGEGVFACREILQALERGQSFSHIPGLCLPKLGKLHATAERAAIELDELPLPRRDLVDRSRYYDLWFHAKYQPGEQLFRPTAAVRTSSGCKHRCTFCTQWQLNKGKYFIRTAQAVAEELEQIQEPCICFVDDETFLDAERMMALADAIERAGIQKRYYGWIRATTVLDHPELLKRWRSIGLDRLFMGIESFTDGDLESYRKGSTTSDNKKAIAFLQEIDVAVLASVIIDPAYGKEDFDRVRHQMAEYPDTEQTFSVLTTAPGTIMTRKMKDQITTDHFDLVDGWHTLLPTGLSLEDFYDQFAQLFSEARKYSMFRWMRPPMRELLPLIYRSKRLVSAIRHGYRDHRPVDNR